MLYEYKDEAILDPRDGDLAKLKYGYLCAKIDEATAMVEKQIELLKSNERLMEKIDAALKIAEREKDK